MRRSLWLLVLLVSGCPPRPPPPWLPAVPDAEAVGMVHVVQAGETLYSICRRHGADLQEVAEVNGIDNPALIHAGLRVFIPDVGGASSLGDPGDDRPRQSGRNTGGRDTVRRFPGRFIWPVQGVVTSKFGVRGRRRHDGLDIGAPEGTPIRAAAAGKVLYVGEQGGYGKLIIVQHEDRWITVYAHNRRNRVAEGATVRQGQIIGEVGQTGRATGPHLHFEIRKGTKPRNPLFFLARPD